MHGPDGAHSKRRPGELGDCSSHPPGGRVHEHRIAGAHMGGVLDEQDSGGQGAVRCGGRREVQRLEHPHGHRSRGDHDFGQPA